MIAYFDESSARGGPDDIFTLGGFVATDRRCRRIEQFWGRALGRRTFHMVDFENRRREFENWPSPKRRIPFIASLADSVKGNAVLLVAHSVRVSIMRGPSGSHTDFC